MTQQYEVLHGHVHGVFVILEVLIKEVSFFILLGHVLAIKLCVYIVIVIVIVQIEG